MTRPAYEYVNDLGLLLRGHPEPIGQRAGVALQLLAHAMMAQGKAESGECGLDFHYGPYADAVNALHAVGFPQNHDIDWSMALQASSMPAKPAPDER